ncbi:MAG: Rieske (2Fe-2S) protein [Flavobacteriales bacterium]
MEIVRSTRWRAVQDGRLPGLPEGGMVRVVVGKRPVLFVRHDGSLRAMEDRCPHQGRALSGGWMDDGHVVCPFHRFHFDPVTGACRHGLTVNVGTYAVRENEKGVWMGTPYTTLRLFGIDLW